MGKQKIPFKTGDVVRLNSSDVKMSVAGITEGRVDCVWMDSHGHYQNQDFDPGVLVSAGDKSA